MNVPARLALFATPALLLGVVSTVPASAATATHFKNCTQMHKTYPHGVGKPGAKNKGGKVSGPPKTSASLYSANHTLDRDKDGIACEA
jgi:hypothetical protein